MTDTIRTSSQPHRPPNAIPTVEGVCVLAVGSLIVAIIGRAANVDALALTGGYGVLFMGVGAAPFQLLPGMSLTARLTAATLVGFGVILGVGGLMADTGFWHPGAAALLVGLVAIALHIAGVLRAPNARLRADTPAARIWPIALTVPPARLRASLSLALVGTLLWLIPAITTRDPNPGVGGFLTSISPLWYVGIAAVVLAFVVGRTSSLTAATAVVSFALASTLTPALVYATPRAATAGKQMQLTQYALMHHHFSVTSGIYPAFSAMFSGLAWLLTLLGIHGMIGPHSLLAVATYWPVLLALLRVAALGLLAERLLPTTSRQWSAVMLVLLVDSLGDDYFSPQSIGYVMALGALAICVDGLTAKPLSSRATFWLLAFVGLTLAPTHELSPYVLAGALIVLAIFGQAPAWSAVPIAIPTLAWLGVVHTAVGQSFSFGQLFDVSNFAPPATAATPGLERLAVVGQQSHALLAALLIVIATGAIGFFAKVRQKRVWAYALCPIVGISLIAINPYGNEGIFRATLFAIPWMATLAALIPDPGHMLRPLRNAAVRSVSIAAYLLALLATFVIAGYSMDAAKMLPASDVTIGQVMAGYPPRDAIVLSVGSGDNPLGQPPFTVNYLQLVWDQVATAPQFHTFHPTRLTLLQLTDAYGIAAGLQGAKPTSPEYIVWSISDLRHAQAYGLQTPAQLRRWLQLLQTSSYWKLVARSGQTYLFELER